MNYYSLVTLDDIRNQINCAHPAVRYRFPTDGTEPYECTECRARFTWPAIDLLNESKGGAPNAFAPQEAI